MGNVFFFIIGFFSGVTLVLYYGHLQIQKHRIKQSDLIEQLKKETNDLNEKTQIVQDRLQKVGELTKIQLDMAARAEQPSMNGLHSRYKNSLMDEIKRIEGEKHDIMRSIIQDGFDPLVTLLNDNGEKETMKLSEYMKRNQISFEVDKPLETIENKNNIDTNKPRKVGKFFVYQGGNNPINN